MVRCDKPEKGTLNIQKDTLQETAELQHFLREKQGASPGPLFFHVSDNRTTPRKDMRERQRVASERRNPHEGQLPASRNLSAGDCMERNQPLTPPCTQPPTTAQPPAVAGYPATRASTHSLVQQLLLIYWCLFLLVHKPPLLLRELTQ